MSGGDDELLEVFREEVGAQLEEMDELVSGPPSTWEVDGLFHLVHNVKGAARMIGAASFAEAAHALEDLLGAMRSGARVTRAVAALVREGISLLHACFAGLGAGAEPDVSEYTERVRDRLRGRRPAAKSAVARGVEAPSGPASSDEPAHRGEPTTADSGAGTIRIGMEKLAGLMSLGVELTTSTHRQEAHHRLAVELSAELASLRRRHPQLARDAVLLRAASLGRELVRELERGAARHRQLSGRLSEAIRELRMVRVGTLRFALSRAVRDAASRSDRLVEFRAEGGDTELDRSVLERLRDPLLHLVRNAVAHAIEPRDEREAAGKPVVGSVVLRARSEGPWVEIDIEDDGRGIDPRAVRARAHRDGLLGEREGASLDDRALLDVVFEPGFTTADSVSELAGRGIGMAIVQARTTELGGHVELHTQLGRGTCVRLRVPLTLLTIRALMVRVGDRVAAIPLTSVERASSIRASDIRTVDAADVIAIGPALVPVASLGAVLGLSTELGEHNSAVVLASGGRRRAFVVDEVLGDRELTIQSLPWNLDHVPGLSGVAAGESEDVILVLDAQSLLATGETVRASTDVLGAAPVSRQRRILVVDDSVTSRTLEKNILSSAGYDVVMAANGEDALEILADGRVDLVVTDVDMPKLNGIELTRSIRARPELAEVPVILVTSLGSDEDRRRGADAGADAYIVKGAFDQDDLLRAVGRLL